MTLLCRKEKKNHNKWEQYMARLMYAIWPTCTREGSVLPQRGRLSVVGADDDGAVLLAVEVPPAGRALDAHSGGISKLQVEGVGWRIGVGAEAICAAVAQVFAALA